MVETEGTEKHITLMLRETRHWVCIGIFFYCDGPRQDYGAVE
jgi:hypothetical protein